MKQGLVKQGMYREQENSHLGWPDTGVQCPEYRGNDIMMELKATTNFY